MPFTRPIATLACVFIAILASIGCGTSETTTNQVVLYTSLNEPTARSVIAAFEDETGIRVIVQADTERDKTVGLVQALIEERSRPRADVFWNSEAANMERLKEHDVLERLVPPPSTAHNIPPEYCDPDGYWWGFAARARVLIVNTELVPEEDRPNSILDIIDPKWRGKAAIVRPVTGTTLTHLIALFDLWGEEETNRYIDGILSNDCHLPPGNGRLARLVGEGQIHFGLTDTSDYLLVKNEGFPVEAIYPDQDGIGALVIPNTVARVAGGPNPENAQRLIEFLLSEEAERILAFHQRGHIPLRPTVDRPAHIRIPGEFDDMTVNFISVGNQLEARLREFDQRFP